jgi:hypothetical protein
MKTRLRQGSYPQSIPVALLSNPSRQQHLTTSQVSSLPSFTLRITLTTSTQARRPTESARDTDASSQSHSHELKIDVGWIALDPGVPIHTCVARVRFHFDQRGKADILTLAKKSSPVEFDGTRGTRRRLHEHRYSSAVYFCAPSKRIGDK